MDKCSTRMAAVMFLALVGALFLSGCSSVPLNYTPADEQGLPADFSGGWISDGGASLLFFRQNGAKVTGTWNDMSVEGVTPLFVGAFPRATCCSVEGEIKGRVLHGKVSQPAKGYWYCCRGHGGENFQFDMALSSDGRGGSCRYVLSIVPLPSRKVSEIVHRVVLGPATNFISCAPGTDNWWLRGGIVCQMPVDANGSPLFKTCPPNTISRQYRGVPAFPIRKVLVTTGFSGDTSGAITPGLFAVPVDEPRRVNYCPDAPYSWLNSVIRCEPLWQMRAQSGTVFKKSFEVEGITYWGQMVPMWGYTLNEIVQTGLTPRSMRLEVYQKDPDLGGVPIQINDLTWRDEKGAWVQDVEITPHWSKSYTVFRPALRQGQPVGFEVSTTNEPPLEMFLDPVLVASVDVLEISRWRTGILLQAKNSTLPRLLKEGSNDRLQHLLTRGEKAVLDYALQADLAKNRAQEALEKGSSPTQDREWALVYNERLAVLSAIVSAIKEELANRSR